MTRTVRLSFDREEVRRALVDYAVFSRSLEVPQGARLTILGVTGCVLEFSEPISRGSAEHGPQVG